MASISSADSASAELLACILGEADYSDALLRRALAEEEGRALFSVVVEQLGDLFHPKWCDAYARLFSRVTGLLRPGTDSAAMLHRYERVRRVRKCTQQGVKRVFVLSRVTLGADVAVTSVLMDAAAHRFPGAEIVFAGSRKNFGLFAGRPGISHLDFSYPRRGALAERLAVRPRLGEPDSIVIDPDSRLTQLGMLPVCDDDDYYFFESRGYGGESDDPLPVLASRWAAAVFETAGAAWIAPGEPQVTADAAVSFGVGENPEKRLSTEFEEQLLRELTSRNLSVLLDCGAGGEEADRAEMHARSVPGVQLFRGDYAPFAAAVQKARLYVGYDSAGQHVAAACGTPLLTVFAGQTCERMYQRWKPWGPGVREVVRVNGEPWKSALSRAAAALDRVLEAPVRGATE